MDVYSSTASLVSTNKQDKTLYPSKHSIAQNEVCKETKWRRERAEEKGRHAGTRVVDFLNLATVISITIIGAVYISHLQEHVSRLQHRIEASAVSISHLQQRIEALESRSCDQSKVETDKRVERFKDEKVRFRRQADESPHKRAEHHGIASYNIAMMIGDPANIQINQPDEEPEHKFRPNTHSADRRKCGTLYQRRDKQKWCTPNTNSPGQKITRYMTSSANHKYNYFSKARWMNHTKSIRNFNLTHEGEVVVKSEGVYIVHASVFFTDLDSRDNPSYGVYKNDEFGNNRTMLSKCVISLADSDDDDDDSGVYPCQAWQLAHLKAGDRVFLSIGAFTWFQVERETLHLALIKLNEHSL